MKITSGDLNNLPVFTQSGKNLGRVDSFDIDIDLNKITHFYVKTGLIKGLWHEKLMIAHEQVISIAKDKMIVDDSLGSAEKSKLSPVPTLGVDPS